MPTEPLLTLRLRPDQRAEAKRVRQLRKAAEALRSSVSHGSYGDEELGQFWRLAESAGLTLMASNTELAGRAGLGDNFFLSVVRDRRRPKLVNFLKALTAIIDVANERLFEIDRVNDISKYRLEPEQTISSLRIEQDCSELLSLATSLSRMARHEIEKLDNERPNDPMTIEGNEKQRELLLIFANGFERIAVALVAFAENTNKPLLLGRARDVVNSLGRQVNAWWRKNGAEAVDWGMRLPVMTAGVAMLGWAGADMAVATSAVAAIVGGPKVIDMIRDRTKSK